MKLFVVKFKDEVDLSTLTSEAEVTVSDGTTTVTGKVVTSTAAIPEPEPQLVPHNHPAAIGPATPIS